MIKNVVTNKGKLSFLTKLGFEKRILESAFLGGCDSEYFIIKYKNSKYYMDFIIRYDDVETNNIEIFTNNEFDINGRWMIENHSYNNMKNVKEFDYSNLEKFNKYITKTILSKR